MAQSGVERTQRIALRTLVVAGFAGAAWLLSAAAAQAASAQPFDGTALSAVNLPGTSSTAARTESGAAGPAVTDTLGKAAEPVVGLTSALLKPVVAGSDRASTVDLPASDAPAVSDRPASAGRDTRPARQAHTGTRTVPAGATGVAGTGTTGRKTSVPTGALTGVPIGAPAGTENSGLLRAVTGLVQPLGLGGAVAGPTTLLTPLTRVVDPVIAPLTSAVRPVTDVLRSAAAPVTSMLGSVTRPLTGQTFRSTGGAYTPSTGRSAAPATGAYAVMVDGPVPTSVGTTAPAYSPAGHPAAFGNAAGGKGAGNLPDRPLPTPLRGHPGAGGGSLTTGSGSHPDGGSFAVGSTAVAGSMVDSHRLLTATDVEVAWLVAMDPTVSPD